MCLCGFRLSEAREPQSLPYIRMLCFDLAAESQFVKCEGFKMERGQELQLGRASLNQGGFQMNAQGTEEDILLAGIIVWTLWFDLRVPSYTGDF